VAGTRIASVSGIRGVVGDGLDPSIVAEFAAAYATGQAAGSIVVGHDGRISAPVFLPAVLSAVTATGRDALLAGPIATPTLGGLVRDLGAAGGIQISASHNPPQYNGLKFFQPAGMVLGPDAGRAVLERFAARSPGWASWDALGKVRNLDEPDGNHANRVLATVDVAAIRRARLVVALDACHGSGGRLGEAILRALGTEAVVLGGQPDGRYDHPPEPTEANLRRFAGLVPALGAAVGFAQDPDADRLAIVDETGRYIGEELTLALAASHRLGTGRGRAVGPVVMNLSTSRTTEILAERAMQAHSAVLGGEGNGGVIDPRVGFVRDSFAAMAGVLDLLAATARPLSELVDALPRFAMVKDQYPLGDAPAAVGELLDRIASAHPEARADRRDGLRLDWPDRWAHVRSSNTEPIVRVIAEAAEAAPARALADEVGRLVVAAGRGS